MTAFVVLGAPRSGTSLVAGILHRNGIDMGGFPGIDPKRTDANPSGFYEDVLLVNINERILRAMECSLTTAPTEQCWERIAGKDFGVAQALQERAAHGIPWGFKDPRTVLVWRRYAPHLTDEMDARLIICHRNQDSAVKSIARVYNYLPMLNAISLFIEYQARMAEIAQGAHPVCHVEFEKWWHNQQAQAAELSEFVGRDLDLSHWDESLWRC